jgi:hypothetical protein
MEVERGPVYPHHTMLDDIQISTSSYAAIKVDMVDDNSKDLKLTMQDAVTRRVQWRRTSIDIDPSVAASASTTPTQLKTSPALMSPEARLSPSPNPEQMHLSPIRDPPRLPPIKEQMHPSPLRDQPR